MSTRVLYEFQKQLKFYKEQLIEHFTQGVENYEEYNKELETLKVGDGRLINVVPEVYNYSIFSLRATR